MLQGLPLLRPHAAVTNLFDGVHEDLQVYCYEDSKLLKLFASVVRVLYDYDVLGEDTIKFWYKKGSQPKVCGVPSLND